MHLSIRRDTSLKLHSPRMRETTRHVSHAASDWQRTFDCEVWNGVSECMRRKFPAGIEDLISISYCISRFYLYFYSLAIVLLSKPMASLVNIGTARNSCSFSALNWNAVFIRNVNLTEVEDSFKKKLVLISRGTISGNYNYNGNAPFDCYIFDCCIDRARVRIT